MVGSAAGVSAYAYCIGILSYVPLWELAVFGAAVGALSQLGDLTVSAFKREAGVKDTGTAMGAHGGMLDRIDGFLWSLPATYLFFITVL
jgi:phosphatidate cytidylyltransferase